MIQNYSKPGTRIYQTLEVTTTPVADMLSAVCVGPAYDLYRYGIDSIPTATYNGAATGTGSVPGIVLYSSATHATELDQASIELYATDIAAPRFPGVFQANELFKTTQENVYNTTKNLMVLNGSTEALDPELGGEPIRVGDYIASAGEALTEFAPANKNFVVKAKIVELIGKPIDSSISAIQAVNASAITDAKPTIPAIATYLGLNPISVTITTVKGGSGAAVEYIATSPSYATSCKITNDNRALWDGTGLSIEPPTTGVSTVGSIFSFTATPATRSAVTFTGFRTDIPIPEFAGLHGDVGLGNIYNIYRFFTGKVDSTATASWRYDSASNAIILNGPISLNVPNKTSTTTVCSVNMGSISVQYRNLALGDYNEDVIHIGSNQDIINYFGVIDPMNTLAYGCYCALQGVTNNTTEAKGVYAIRTNGTDLESFKNAWLQTETNDYTYIFNILTHDYSILKEAQTFVQECSTPFKKHWRTMCIGLKDMDVSGQIIDPPASGYWQGMLSDSSSISLDDVITILNPEFNVNTVTSGGVETSIVAGDILRVGATGNFTIKRILAHNMVQLSTPFTGTVNMLGTISFVKSNSALARLNWVSDQAQSYNDRRVWGVWCSNPVSSLTGTVVDCMFAASEVAGIASAVPPQQGLTNFDLSTVRALPDMYIAYTEDQLNKAASNGVCLISQDTKNGPCYVRHQLTTETDKGSMYYEISFTKNFDNISYQVKEIFDSYVGKRNVIERTLNDIKTAEQFLLDGLMNTSIGQELIGPQLVEYQNLTVQQDPVMKDRVIMSVEYGLPSPLNYLVIYQYAYVASVTITA